MGAVVLFVVSAATMVVLFLILVWNSYIAYKPGGGYRFVCIYQPGGIFYKLEQHFLIHGSQLQFYLDRARVNSMGFCRDYGQHIDSKQAFERKLSYDWFV